ncbi:hypothetical protein WJX84_010923 [Apatococcus fuscideae]|uniref:Protein kinase domain-containing protein n=1 Tax=Apatococcus fuscideae TaxID=2026836 RepID=A0AAW1TJ65_9CHLO
MGCTSSQPLDAGGEQVSRVSAGAATIPAIVPAAPSSRYPPAELATPPSCSVEPTGTGSEARPSTRERPEEVGNQPLPRMTHCPRPANDAARIAAVNSTCLCRGLPQERFDHFTRLVKGVLKVPICQITLVEDKLVYGKASHGGLRSENPLPRDVAFCSWALLPKNPEMLVVEDTLLDGRFRDNPVVVGEPHIRFYAGAPLIASNGHALGTLCGMDFEPRHLDGHLLQILTLTTPTSTLDPFALASSTSSLTTPTASLDRTARKDFKEHRNAAELRSMRSTEDLKHGFMLCQVAMQPGRSCLSPTPGVPWWAISLDKAVHQSLWDIFEVDPWSKEAALNNLARKVGKEVEIAAAVKAKGSLKAFNITFKRHYGDLDASTVPIGIPSFISASASEAPDLCFVMVSEATQLGGLSRSQSVGTPLFHAPSLGQPGVEVTEDIFASVSLGPLLGKGSFGKVFRGTWQGMTVAVKILEKVLQPADRVGGLDYVQHSLEATLGVGLDHRNLVHTLACHSRLSRGMVGHVSGIDRPIADHEPCVLESWILLEYCCKGSLLDALFKGWLRTERSLLDGAPNFGAVLQTALEIAEALEYLHAANILHGDLTCNNIMLKGQPEDKRGFVAKVGDFGLSRLMEAETDSLETATHGTVTHMPPELLMDGRLSRATDVYSFGVILVLCWGMYGR